MFEKMSETLAKAIIFTMMLFVAVNLSAGTDLGAVTDLQKILNTLPAIPIAGKQSKLEFGGDSWNIKVDGSLFSAGDFIIESENSKGAHIKLVLTHLYASKKVLGKEIGTWVKTPETVILLGYEAGPSPKLFVRTGDETLEVDTSANEPPMVDSETPTGEETEPSPDETEE